MRFLAPTLDLSPMGMFKKVTAEDIVGCLDPPAPCAQPPPRDKESEGRKHEDEEDEGGNETLQGGGGQTHEENKGKDNGNGTQV